MPSFLVAQFFVAMQRHLPRNRHGRKWGRASVSTEGGMLSRLKTGFHQAESELPDTGAWFAKLLSHPVSQYLVCLTFALLLRAVTFGDPAVHIDEAFYFLVGHMMNDGALLYVDVWDRKPPLIFVLYAGFAKISLSPLSYQLAALIFATTTAFLVVRIALKWTEVQGALLAGVVYLALLNTFEGIGGQTPIFYNLYVAFAAWAVVTSIEQLGKGEVPHRIYAAMLACGLAIMTKQTALFESVAFGLYCTFLLWRSGGVPWLKVGAMALLGALPTLAIAGFYFQIGHWDEFWHAMFISNLEKQSANPFQYAGRIFGMLFKIWLIVALVLVSIRRVADPFKGFAVTWILAALIGFLAVPNFYAHYLLPMAVSASAIASVELNRRFFGIVWAGFMLLIAVFVSQPFNIEKHGESRQSMKYLSHLAAEQDSLLVFDGPPGLYTLSGHKPRSPLAFPNHLNHEIERDVSHISTQSEMRSILAARPGAIAVTAEPRVIQFNRENWGMVRNFARDNCRLLGSAEVFEIGRSDSVLLYGNC